MREQLDEMVGEYREMRDNIPCRQSDKDKRLALLRLLRAVVADARYDYDTRLAYAASVITENRHLCEVCDVQS